MLILPLKSGSMLVAKPTLFRFNVPGEGWFIAGGECGSMLVVIYINMINIDKLNYYRSIKM